MEMEEKIGMNKTNLPLIIIYFLVLSIGQTSLSVGYSKNIKNVDWENPLPRFSQMDVNLHDLVELIGEGQLILFMPPQKIELWTHGQIKSYDNARLACAMTVVDLPEETVRLRFSAIAKTLAAFPQYKEVQNVAMRDNHVMVKYIEEFDLGAFPLKSAYYWQYTAEDNGDVSALLHKGDVDASALRFEFLPISNKKTLLVLTHWHDMASASFFYRLFLKANPETKMTSIPVATSMMIQQCKETFLEDSGIKRQERHTYGSKMDIPLYSIRSDLKQTLYKIAQIGTPILLHPKKDYAYNGGKLPLQFATCVQTYPVPISLIKPHIWDVKTMPEYFPQFDHVSEAPLPEGKKIQIQMKYGVGFISLKLNFTFDYLIYNNNVSHFQNPNGDILILGAEEIVEVSTPSNKPATIQVYTVGSLIGKNAPWLIRYLEKSLPEADLMRNVAMALVRVEQQLPWMIDKLGHSCNDKKYIDNQSSLPLLR